MRIVTALLCTLALAAADSPAVKNFQEAFAGNDAYAKRRATTALAANDAGDVDTVIPLLMQALGDRATAEMAIDATRARLSAAGVPFPRGSEPAKWTEWLQARQKDREAKKKIENLDKKPAAPPAAGTAAKPAEETAAETAPAPVAEAVQAPPLVPTDELGKIDRIVYKNGSVLRGYVRSRRVDADGNLVSIRIVHPDGRGEEVIEAKAIARIEEDIE